MKVRHLILFFLFISVTSFTSNGSTSPIRTSKKAQLAFYKMIGGNGFDAANFLIETRDGNYILGGRSNSYSNGNMNMNVVKVSPSGNVIWNRNYGEQESEEAYDGIACEDGGYIFVGYSDSFGAGSDMKDMWVVKTDAEGTKTWAKTYGTKTSIDEAHSIVASEDGGYLILGSTLSLANGKKSISLLKIDASGNKIWQKDFGGEKSTEANQLIKTDTGYAIIGSTEAKGHGKWDIWLIAIDKEGNKTWDKTYGGADNEMANSIKIMPDGSFILVGYTYTFAEGSLDAWIIKTDKTGKKLWDKAIGGLSTDEAFGIAFNDKNEIIVAGYTDIYEPDEYFNNISPLENNILLVKFDAEGEEVWQRSIGGNKSQSAKGIIATADGGFLLGGYTNESDEEKSTDMLFLKVNDKGE